MLETVGKQSSLSWSKVNLLQNLKTLKTETFRVTSVILASIFDLPYSFLFFIKLTSRFPLNCGFANVHFHEVTTKVKLFYGFCANVLFLPLPLSH